VGEDQPHAGVALARLHGVAAERGNPAACMDEHRQPALIREREHRLERGVVEREPLRARMELDPACATVEGALGLGERVVLGVEPAEREQPSVRPLGLVDDHVVGGRIAVGLVHREDESARVDSLERADQLFAAASVAVRVVEPDVRVDVEQVEVRDVFAQPVEPRQHAGVCNHGR
jgi:hypothetical protein